MRPSKCNVFLSAISKEHTTDYATTPIINIAVINRLMDMPLVTESANLKL